MSLKMVILAEVSIIISRKNSLSCFRLAEPVHFAPKGVKTFGFTQGPNGKKVVVCRCPYASNDKQHLCKGVAQWVSCHEKFRPIEYKNLDKSSGGEKTSKISTPDAPPVPAAIKAEPPTAIVPEINKTITPEPPKPKPEPEKIIDVTEDKVPAQNTESCDIVYPDQLVLSCNGYDIRGEKVGDGEYEIRITSGGVFIANINSCGIVVGKHSRLKTEELNAANGSVSVAFDNFEKMNIHLQQDPAPIANIAFGYTKLSVCVK